MTAGQAKAGPDRHTQEIKEQIDLRLSTMVAETDPAELYEPVRYVLSGGGKRLRPALVLLAARIFGAEERKAMPAALAVEVFHNFTLVHDDIMDNAPERRGRPTVHVKWDDGTAILTGDFLLSLSYRLLADCPGEHLPELLRTYHEMVRMLCEGQVLDAAFESRHAVSSAEYLRMIDRKTGALLSACLKLGGILGQADQKCLVTLADVGTSMGRAFQIRDDLLDLIANDDRWGKTRGGDLMQAKKTYLLTRALESEDPELKDWFESAVMKGGLQEERIDEAHRRLEKSGILDDAVAAIDDYSKRASRSLQSLPQNEATVTLQHLIERLRSRLH